MPQVMYARCIPADPPRDRRSRRRNLRRAYDFRRSRFAHWTGDRRRAWIVRFTAEDLIASSSSIARTRLRRRSIFVPCTSRKSLSCSRNAATRIAELNNVLYRKLERAEKFPPAPPGCEIRRSLPEEADSAGAIVESAFFPDGAPEPYRGLVAPFYQMDRALAFVAAIDGKLVACGTGLVIPEHKMFALCGRRHAGGVSKRGLQTALLRARMAAAVEAGCEYAVVVTQGGSASQRNAERLGFRVAYSKVTVIKQLEA